jgi:hypothetical protein
MSLELITCDGVDVHMGIPVRLPLVGCCPKELVRGKKDLLMIRALGNHEFLFNPLEPIFCIHGVFVLWEGGGGKFTETLPNKTGGVVEVGVLAAGWATYYWGSTALLASAGSGCWVAVQG